MYQPSEIAIDKDYQVQLGPQTTPIIVKEQQDHKWSPKISVAQVE